MKHGDRAAIEKSIRMLTDEMRDKRYEIRIKEEELKELKHQLGALKSSQQWRKDMIN